MVDPADSHVGPGGGRDIADDGIAGDGFRIDDVVDRVVLCQTWQASRNGPWMMKAEMKSAIYYCS